MNVSPISSRILMYYAWQLKPEQFSIPSFWNMIPTYGIYSLAGCAWLSMWCWVEGKSEGELRREKDEKGESGTSAGGDGAESSHLQDICHRSWVCPGSALQPTTETLYSVRAIYCRSLPPTLTHWFLYRVSQWNVKMYIFLNCICHTLQP